MGGGGYEGYEADGGRVKPAGAGEADGGRVWGVAGMRIKKTAGAGDDV